MLWHKVYLEFVVLCFFTIFLINVLHKSKWCTDILFDKKIVFLSILLCYNMESKVIMNIWKIQKSISTSIPDKQNGTSTVGQNLLAEKINFKVTSSSRNRVTGIAFGITFEPFI